MVFHAAVDYAVVDAVLVYEGGDGAAGSHLVYHVQVIVVALGLGLLGVDVLAQGGVEQGPLQIVDRQGVARQDALDIAVVYHALHGPAGVGVKGEGGAHDPDDLAAVLLFIAQQADEPVIIPGVRGLPAAALAEDELVPLPGGPVPEAGGVEVYALPAVLAAADYDPVPLFKVPALHHREAAVGVPDYAAVHAALLRQTPAALQLHVLRVHGGAVEILRGHPVLFHRLKGGVGCGEKLRAGKIRGGVFGHDKIHGNTILSFFVLL